MSKQTNPIEGVLRRTVLKASAVTVGTFGLTTPATSTEREDGETETTDDDEETETPEGDQEDEDAGGVEEPEDPDPEVDEPVDFSGEVLSSHADFPDEVGAEFTITYAEGDMGTVEIDQDDLSSVVVAELTWQPEGTTGWHTHHGPVIVSIAEGELELVNELDCVTRTYTAGEGFVAQGQDNIHRATNPSETERAVVYATYLGVPDGGPPTVWVEPPGC